MALTFETHKTYNINGLTKSQYHKILDGLEEIKTHSREASALYGELYNNIKT